MSKSQPAEVETGPRCEICGSRAFIDRERRPAAICRGCGAFERHRALVREFADLLSQGSGACLEVAPISPEVYGGFLRRRGWRYVSIDRWRTGNPHDPRRAEFVDFELDVRDLRPFGDRAFQLIVVQHVIEEIDVYQQALRELARVLDRTGTALLEIPYRRNLPKSKSHPPDRYGNVWEFGADLLDAVRAVFASAEPRPLREGGYRGEVFVCRHQRREDTGRCCG